MDTATARKRLEEMRDDLDRSIAVLKGEHPADDRTSGYPADPADAGANLSEADRTLAILEAAQGQRSQVLDALAPPGRWQVRHLYPMRPAGPGGTARSTAGGGALRRVPVQGRPAAPLTAHLGAARGQRPPRWHRRAAAAGPRVAGWRLIGMPPIGCRGRARRCAALTAARWCHRVVVVPLRLAVGRAQLAAAQRRTWCAASCARSR